MNQDLKSRIDKFNVKEWLDAISVRYIEGPYKNVAKGWIGLNCFNPECYDKSFHLGISPKGFFKCWKCNISGDLIKLICSISKCSFREAIITIDVHQNLLSENKKISKPIKNKYLQNIIPKEASKEFPPDALSYLIDRNFDSKLIQEYDLYATHNYGNYKFRIIIPIYYHYKLVTFTARDFTNMAKIRYKNCSNEISIIPVKECLYNIDSVNNKAIIVEGPTDVWRIGKGSIATFGTTFTDVQTLKIINLNLKKVTIIFDAEQSAIKQAYSLAHKLSATIKEIKVIELESGDPGSLKQQDINELRRISFE